MRFLDAASRERVRLGWLPILAKSVGTQRRELKSLQGEILGMAHKFKAWAEQADLAAGPQGNVRSTNASRLIRIAITYGIYDEETHALTDLGQVLRIISESTSETPFQWSAGKRFVGLWIVFQASGDVLVEVLRQWPEDNNVSLAQAATLISTVMCELARRAPQEERDRLLEQARRAGTLTSESGLEMARNGLVYPYLEPLRDLAYLKHEEMGGQSGYRLTDSGVRLRHALRSEQGDANTLLKSGLSRVFLAAEGIADQHPSGAQVLARVLRSLLPELMVSENEAPLEPTVLLAQAYLVAEEPGAFIDLEHAHALLQQVQDRSAGKIFLKRGQSIGNLNIAWTDPALLSDSAVWAVAGDDARQNSTRGLALTADATKHEGATRSHANRNEPKLTAGADINRTQNEGEHSARQTLVTVGENQGSSSASQQQSFAVIETKRAHSDEHPIAQQDAPKTTSCSDDVIGLLDDRVPGAVRLWLQYVASLLMPPECGAVDLHLWGGPVASLERLLRLCEDLPEPRLKEKRHTQRDSVSDPQGQKPPICLRPLRQHPIVLKERWILDQLISGWTNEAIDPRIGIKRGLKMSAWFHDDLCILIKQFLAGSGSTPDWRLWPQVRLATRALIQDALSTGIFCSDRLLYHLCSQLGMQPAHTAALNLLDLLTAKERGFVYSESLRFTKQKVEEIRLSGINKESLSVEIPASEDDHGTLLCRFQVTVQARSWFEARERGRTLIHTLLVSRHFHARRSLKRRAYELPGRPDAVEVSEESAPDQTLVVDGPIPHIPGLLWAHDLIMMPPSNLFPSAAESREHRLDLTVQGLLRSRDPDLSPPERLLSVWSAIEQLVSSGKDGKDSTVEVLAAAASVLHFKSEVQRIYHDAMAGLIAAVTFHPENELLQQLVRQWLPQHSPATQELKNIPGALLQSRLAAKTVPRPSHVPARVAMDELWRHRGQLTDLRMAVEHVAPLAAEGLYHFEQITGDGATVPSPLGDGKRLATYFRELYEDVLSFFFYVYEMRNRFVHGGGEFSAIREPAVLEVYERFCALVEPVVEVLVQKDRRDTDLSALWDLARELARDLASLDAKPSISLYRLQSLLDFC